MKGKGKGSTEKAGNKMILKTALLYLVSSTVNYDGYNSRRKLYTYGCNHWQLDLFDWNLVLWKKGKRKTNNYGTYKCYCILPVFTGWKSVVLRCRIWESSSNRVKRFWRWHCWEFNWSREEAK